MGFAIVLILFLLAIFVTFSTIKMVPQGYEWTVQRFGRYTRTLKPGITVLTPFMEARSFPFPSRR